MTRARKKRSRSRISSGADSLREGYRSPKEILLTLLGQKFLGFSLEGGESMLIDEHGLHFQPLLPCGLGDVIENALAFRAGKRRLIKTLGLLTETLAEYGMCAHRLNVVT